MPSPPHCPPNVCAEDYKAAADLFLQNRDEESANVARANYALALYQTGDRGAAVKVRGHISYSHIRTRTYMYSHNIHTYTYCGWRRQACEWRPSEWVWR